MHSEHLGALGKIDAWEALPISPKLFHNNVSHFLLQLLKCMINAEHSLKGFGVEFMSDDDWTEYNLKTGNKTS